LIEIRTNRGGRRRWSIQFKANTILYRRFGSWMLWKINV